MTAGLLWSTSTSWYWPLCDQQSYPIQWAWRRHRWKTIGACEERSWVHAPCPCTENGTKNLSQNQWKKNVMIEHRAVLAVHTGRMSNKTPSSNSPTEIDIMARWKLSDAATQTYACPCSSKAVPFWLPMSHTTMDSSKLPEKSSRLSGSQVKLRMLPANMTNKGIKQKKSQKKLMAIHDIHSKIWDLV